ncbi:hypothetical protein K432DRAFT_388447 [Lepidopterella palustris CBS 459.81]|uniref:Uncharacterized protein n=1 Tax=Lepidopterella palustris CBS 459.81 TaxID=1314670 RepID=A0A8E2EKE9_9PEZI|nr:hypothetical protein K432DRAFT_388447 [Lepidopterella palustris CBS 459.81]
MVEMILSKDFLLQSEPAAVTLANSLQAIAWFKASQYSPVSTATLQQWETITDLEGIRYDCPHQRDKLNVPLLLYTSRRDHTTPHLEKTGQILLLITPEERSYLSRYIDDDTSGDDTANNGTFDVSKVPSHGPAPEIAFAILNWRPAFDIFSINHITENDTAPGSFVPTQPRLYTAGGKELLLQYCCEDKEGRDDRSKKYHISASGIILDRIQQIVSLEHSDEVLQMLQLPQSAWPEEETRRDQLLALAVLEDHIKKQVASF